MAEKRKCSTCHRKPARAKRKGCHRCSKQAWRKANPMRAAFNACRDKARQRKSKRWPDGIPWEITFAAFIIFAAKTRYLTQKGNESGSLTIDRIDHTKGYVPGNLRAITRIENVEKQCREQGKRFEAGFAWKRK